MNRIAGTRVMASRAVGACSVVFALALLVLLGIPPSLAAAKSAKPHANLTLQSAALKGNSYAFWLEKGSISIEDVTKNTGKRRAGPSITRVYLVHGSQQWRLADRAVPALGPGKEHRDESSSDPFATHKYPIGAYTLRICPDAKHEVNAPGATNCRKMQPAHFFVIPRGFLGSLSGTETRADLEQWRSSDAQFNFDQYEGGGVVSYLFSGSVTWTESGTTADGCTISGTGTRSYNDDASIGALSVDYLNERYSGALQDTSGPPYKVTFSGCEDPPPTEAGDYEPAFWNPIVSTSAPFGFGSTSLPGSPAQFGVATWTWTLKTAHGE